MLWVRTWDRGRERGNENMANENDNSLEKKAISENILKGWGITGEAEQIYNTTWRIEDKYVLKRYEDLDTLKKNGQILTVLHEMGIPAAEIIPANSGELYVGRDGRYYMLTKKLPGNKETDIRQEGMAEKMGEILGRLHLAFQKCEDRLMFCDNSFLDEMNGWVAESLLREKWMEEGRFRRAVSHLQEEYEALPRQLIHRDVHFGNFLFDQGEFSGYIDFDLSQKNIRIFDICYFLTGLLSSQIDSGVNTDEWFRIVREVAAGYEKQIPLLPEEKRAIPYVMENIELLFAAYFSRPEQAVYRENALMLFDFVSRHESRLHKLLEE